MGNSILFTSSTLPRNADDHQAPFVLEQAQAWKKERPDDRVVILAPHDQIAERREHIGDVEIHRFQYFWPARWQALAYPAILPNLRSRPWLIFQIPFFLAAQYLVARRIVRDQAIDLVYAHWVMPQGLIAYGLWLSMGVPYVLQNHSSDMTVLLRADSLRKALARKLILRAFGFFCVNEVQKAQALDLFEPDQQSEIAEKMTVLPMGVGLDVSSVRFTAEVEAPWTHTAGTISRLSRKKGIDLLIGAAEHLADQGTRIPIAIAGDGEDRAKLEALPRSADIRFLGFLNGDNKVDFFNQTRSLIFPSTPAGSDVDGLPVSLLEALCCGKPVIAGLATNIEMLAEWQLLQDHVTLLREPRNIVEFSDALERLISRSEEDVRADGARLRQIMERYLWPNLITEYLAAIDRLWTAKQGEGQI